MAAAAAAMVPQAGVGVCGVCAVGISYKTCAIFVPSAAGGGVDILTRTLGDVVYTAFGPDVDR